MGGVMKGAHGHMHSAYSSNSRKRWINAYIVMVIVCVVFGCGILGLMGLHRLKERRILNLLIKEKDDQILSLHHLLQKEREHMQEVKRKTEEMKLKIFSLRSQKTELNGRVQDMQSTISSLKEEQRTIELAFQEKQNEVELLRDQYMEVKDQNSRAKALTEVLQQKETEIEDLKQQLQLRGAKIASVSADEHSVISENTTAAKANLSGSETKIDENKDRDMHVKKNTAEEMESTWNDGSRYRETESSMQSGGHRENGRLITGTSDELDRLESSQERSSENGTDDDRRSEQVESSETGVRKNEYETEKIGNMGNEEQRHRDEDAEAHFTDSKGFSTMEDTNSRRISESQRSDNQELRVHQGLMKLEMQENSHSGHHRGKRSYLKRAKGKRWRPIGEQTEGKRSSRSIIASTMRDQGLVEGVEEIGDRREGAKTRNQEKIQHSIMGLRMQNESVSENQRFEMNDKLPDAGNGEAMSDVKGYTEENNGENSEDSSPKIKPQNMVKPEDNEDTSQKVAKYDLSNQFENGWEVKLTNSSSKKSQISLDEVAKHSAVKIEDNGSFSKGAANHAEEEEQSKEKEITITEQTENKNDGQLNNRLGQKEVAETNEDADGIQIEHLEESELGEDSEDKEQSDEPEF